MAMRRIVYCVGAVLLTFVFSFGVFQAAVLGQPPGDLYQSGPDPIAPELPQKDLDAAAEGTSTADKNNGELDFLDKSLTDISRTQVTAGTMGEEVSTVSRTTSTVARSPAAVYVVTNEMIKRSGARNLPEVLRLVPGVDVARIADGTWAISIRGFNAHFSNKLLVQIDGRAVYTPEFGGVWWDMQQVLLEDIERIEVIRGPGGAIWGANAVNGIINIITKSSADTQGIYAYSGGGKEHRSFNAFRAGGRQDALCWRMYGMQGDDAPGYWPGPGPAWDPYQYAQGGFRTDWTPTCCDTLTLQGDFIGTRSTENQDWAGFNPGLTRTRGTNFLGRWRRVLSDDSDWSVQLYYDGWIRRVGGVDAFNAYQNTFDLDSQWHTHLGQCHDVVYGFGYRNYEMDVAFDSPNFEFVPPQDSLGIISYFIQDTIELSSDRFYAVLGVKCLHNTFTNFEYQPSVKLLFTPNEQTSIWASIGRAVRIPAQGTRDLRLLGGLVVGNRNLVSEDVLAYEAGIRQQSTDRFYWDLAVFFNRYDNLIGISPDVPPSVVSNVGHGDTYGFELAATYQVNPNWQLRGCYSFFAEHLSYGPNGGPLIYVPGLTPRNQCNLQSGWNLSDDTTLDMIWRYVDSLASGRVPSYLVMDLRWAWQATDGLELSVVGRNLFDSPHLEFIDSFGQATEVEAGVYGMVSWRR